MGLTAAILGALGAIAAAFGVIDILELSEERLFHENLDWSFWMFAAMVLLLGCIACLLARRQNSPEE
jgi:hypothetical protein